jgi:argininosuccinate lyase
VLSLRNSVSSRTSFGGTAPKNVREQAESWRKRLQNDAISG